MVRRMHATYLGGERREICFGPRLGRPAPSLTLAKIARQLNDEPGGRRRDDHRA
jgi:hypothetical protein